MTSQSFGKSMLSRKTTYSMETTLLSEMACQNLQTTTTVENTAPGVPWEEDIPSEEKWDTPKSPQCLSWYQFQPQIVKVRPWLSWHKVADDLLRALSSIRQFTINSFSFS